MSVIRPRRWPQASARTTLPPCTPVNCLESVRSTIQYGQTRLGVTIVSSLNMYSHLAAPRDQNGEVKETPGAAADEAAGEAQKARHCIVESGLKEGRSLAK